MSAKRPVILMAILLALIGAYVASPMLRDHQLATRFDPDPSGARRGTEPPLAGSNSLSGLVVAQQPDGRWLASFDYFYTGGPSAAVVHMYQVVKDGPTKGRTNWSVSTATALRGAHRYTAYVNNPNPNEMYTTIQVVAQMTTGHQVTKVVVDQRIQWPDPVVVEVDKALAAGTPEAVVERAVQLIDVGRRDDLAKARTLLQTLVDKSPRTDAAYVELGRVAMKSNWSPSGLREGEALIGSALQINPTSANAKVLLGYVYAHQGRHKDAEKLFAEAAETNPPNLWLWANWGEVLAMQGKRDAAIAKYREATARPPTKNTYDRARHDAYDKLMLLLDAKGDFSGMESLLKQRADEYPGSECFSVDYARFIMLQRADAEAALAVLRDSPSPHCDGPTTRLTQGLARYITWSRIPDGPARVEALLQARAFQPVGPDLFYALASSEAGSAVAQQLVATGEKLAVQDNRQMDALAYSLSKSDTRTTRRLLRLGAQPTAEIGPERMPAALIPVLTRDLEGIRTMQRAGVDYTKLRYRGSTAVEHARERGDDKLLHLLDPRSGRL
jgi:tetratricopeptide (TPR) repeat protein